MVKRLGLGMLIGAIVGALFAAGAIAAFQGAGMWTNAIFAYVFAAATGGLTGLVAGKPIWAKGAMIEAWLKAFVGALLAAAGMFALGKWGGDAPLAIAQLHITKDALAAQPATSLPIVAAVLGALFGLDNTPEKEGDAKTRVATKTRVAADDAGEASEGADEAAPAAKKRAP
jgi:hypothetical protein